MHPETFLADSLQRRGYHFFIAREARPPDYFFVLGINNSAYAQFNRASRHKKKYHQDSAAKFLSELGAKRIRGDDAQRQKAIHDQVQDAIDAQRGR